MFRSISKFAIITALAGFTLTSANAQTMDPGPMHKTVHVQTIINYLNEFGIRNELTQLSGGALAIVTPTDDNHLLMIIMDTCAASTGPGCSELGVLVGSPVIGLPYASDLENLTTLNALNLELDAGKALIVEGAPLFVRYEHFHYGISKGNLMNDIAAVAMTSDLFFRTLADLKQQSARLSGFGAPSSQLEGDVSRKLDLNFRASRMSDLLLSEAVRQFLRTGQAMESPVLFAVGPGGKWSAYKDDQ